MGAYQIMQDSNRRPLRSTGRAMYGKNVSAAPTVWPNGSSYRMPFAVSRDLQTAVLSGKELYFRVTDPMLKDTAHGGQVQSGFDFQFETLASQPIPYVIKSYDGVNGTLMGVINLNLAGSTAATRGFFYFSNPAWTTSKEDHDNTFPNATSVLFLPSKVDKSGSLLNMSNDLPAIPSSEPQLINPGAKCNGSSDQASRDLTGTCGDFLVSFLCQALVNNSDNSPCAFGSGTGSTVIYMRHCYATPNGNKPTTDITNCWRAGFSFSSTLQADYETDQDTADTNLQHIVFRRVLGHDLEIYINGVLVPWRWSYNSPGLNLSQRIDFTSQKLFIGRGSVAGSRFWNGYLDCFKFYKDDPKSAAWALSEYNNLMDIDGAVIFGSPEQINQSSLWGEAIKVQCDQSGNVTFKSDKYSASDQAGDTISLDPLQKFTNPSHGSFSDQGSNNVQYTNNGDAIDPDNDGSVHLRNVSGGKVIIPVRAHIILVSPPPLSGYYKTPNIYNGDGSIRKTVNSVSNVDQLQSLLSGKTSSWAATNCIKINADFGAANTNGSPTVINVGGTSTDPLVIFMDNAGLDTTASWNGRPTVYNTCLVLAAPYIWLYGVQCQLMPKDLNDHWPVVGSPTDNNTTMIEFRAPNCFVTACHTCGSRHILNNPNNYYAHDCQMNFNWFEWKFQSTGSVGGGDTCIRMDGKRSSDPQVSQRWQSHRNRWTDYPTQFTPPHGTKIGTNARCFYIGGGWGTDATVTSDWEMYYNFVDASPSHIGEFKGGIKAFKYNHCPGTGMLGQPYGGAYTRGGSATGGEFMYNRLNCNLTMINGDKSTYVSNWLVNNNGDPVGTYGLTCRCDDASATAANGGKDKKGLRGADGTVLADCKSSQVLLPYYFEGRSNYPPSSKLGALGAILIAGQNSGCSFECGNTDGSINGSALSFDGSGHPTGSNTSDLSKADITKQSTVPSKYTTGIPPILDATVCGPAASGKTWGT